jgi:anti-anti-sigma factor
MSEAGRSSVERVVLDGEYDLSRKEELREQLGRVDGTCPIELDVHAVRYADSSFYHVLAELRKTHPGCEILISGASPMMLRLLRMLDFEKLFTIS